jgi:hypothetical protein
MTSFQHATRCAYSCREVRYLIGNRFTIIKGSLFLTTVLDVALYAFLLTKIRKGPCDSTYQFLDIHISKQASRKFGTTYPMPDWGSELLAREVSR